MLNDLFWFILGVIVTKLFPWVVTPVWDMVYPKALKAYDNFRRNNPKI